MTGFDVLAWLGHEVAGAAAACLGALFSLAAELGPTGRHGRLLLVLPRWV
jgi:hypothetical protein